MNGLPGREIDQCLLPLGRDSHRHLDVHLIGKALLRRTMNVGVDPQVARDPAVATVFVGDELVRADRATKALLHTRVGTSPGT